MCSLLCSHLFKVKFSGSQCLGTGMTRKEHWDDILPSGDCSQITMFVQ
ncbi:hypothetical protein [Wolbachia endosymbiont (group A) of Pogonocherus hispidulus]